MQHDSCRRYWDEKQLKQKGFDPVHCIGSVNAEARTLSAPVVLVAISDGVHVAPPATRVLRTLKPDANVLTAGSISKSPKALHSRPHLGMG